MFHSTLRLDALHRARIWIADTRPADYHCLTLASESRQIEVRFVSSARELLRRWSAGRPDACLVNIQLPGMSGFDVVDMLRPFPTGTTVCLVGEHYTAEDEVRALRLGVHHYCCKPLEGEILSEVCRRRRQEGRCYR